MALSVAIFKAYWRFRETQKWVLKGDANTAYFQAIANGWRRRYSTPLLWDGEALLQPPGDIRTHVDDFYKALFSSTPWSGLAMALDFWTRFLDRSPVCLYRGECGPYGPVLRGRGVDCHQGYESFLHAGSGWATGQVLPILLELR